MPSSVSSRRKSNKVARPKSDSVSSKTPLSVMTGLTKATQPSTRTSSTRPDNTNLPAKPSQARLTQAQNAAEPKPNVFEFLQQDDSSSSSSSAASDSDSEEEEEQEEEKNRGIEEAHTHANSRLARDAGLPSPESSFRASSPEQTFSVASRDSISTDIDPMTPPDGSPSTAYLRLAHKHISQTRGHHQPRGLSREDHQSDFSAPEDYYISTRTRHSLRKKHSSSPIQDGASGPLVQTDKTKGTKLRSNSRNGTGPVSGYASLAAKLDSSCKDSQKLVPLYRRFENVNHRILLYLQDEISQMEEELQMMDEYDANHRAAIAEAEGAPPEPASRRMEVEARHYSGFHARRTELLERLAYKINQYNDALYSYNRMRHSLPRASLKDVHTYRTWIREHAPIAKNETKFLDHEPDLISMNNTVAIAANAKGDNSILYFIIGVMSAALLLPLLAY